MLRPAAKRHGRRSDTAVAVLAELLVDANPNPWDAKELLVADQNSVIIMGMGHTLPSAVMSRSQPA